MAIVLADDPPVEALTSGPEKENAECYEHRINHVQRHVGCCGQCGAEAFSHIDKGVKAYQCLQPGEIPDFNSCQRRPRVIGAAEEGYRQDNESEHEADVAWRDACSQYQSESGGHNTSKRDERDKDCPMH